MNFYDIGSLGPFLTINDLELDHIAFLLALVAFGIQSTIVHKNVRSVVTADEAKALRVIEPFYGSFQFHVSFLRARNTPSCTCGRRR